MRSRDVEVALFRRVVMMVGVLAIEVHGADALRLVDRLRDRLLTRERLALRASQVSLRGLVFPDVLLIASARLGVGRPVRPGIMDDGPEVRIVPPALQIP